MTKTDKLRKRIKDIILDCAKQVDEGYAIDGSHEEAILSLIERERQEAVEEEIKKRLDELDNLAHAYAEHLDFPTDELREAYWLGIAFMDESLRPTTGKEEK